MKVLLIDQIAKVNYKYTYPLANGLKAAGADVTVVVDQKKEKDKCLCNVVNLYNTDEKNIGKIKKLFNYIDSYTKIEKMLKDDHYDILHSEWFTFSPIDYYFISKFKRLYNIRYVSTVHDILPFNQKLYDYKYHKKLYSLADSIILQAPENMNRFASLFPESKAKTVMVPHGYMLDYVELEDKEKAREYLKIPMKKPVFLFFGQIKKVKGVDILLKAVCKLKKEGFDFYTVIAGSVWKADFTECQEIINDNNLFDVIKTDIKYIPDDEVKFYFSAADVCVLPYTDIYQSGVIQLAYGYRKPVIASSLPAFTQFVKENETGFVFETGDVDALCQKLKAAISMQPELEAMGMRGYTLIKNTLNWNDLAKRIVEECYKC